MPDPYPQQEVTINPHVQPEGQKRERTPLLLESIGTRFTVAGLGRPGVRIHALSGSQCPL